MLPAWGYIVPAVGSSQRLVPVFSLHVSGSVWRAHNGVVVAGHLRHGLVLRVCERVHHASRILCRPELLRLPERVGGVLRHVAGDARPVHGV
jgi:hypothetical protein